MKLIDLAGQRFGKWTVVRRGTNRFSRAYWLCVCDCGASKEVDGDHLRSRKSTSCGSSKHRTNEDREAQILRNTYSKSIKGKRQGKIPHVISFDKWAAMIQNPCIYCGTEGSNTLHDQGKLGKDADGRLSDTVIRANGIDRVDAAKGYTEDNCQPCCGVCNKAKMDMTDNEFKQWIDRVYHHINKKRASGENDEQTRT